MESKKGSRLLYVYPKSRRTIINNVEKGLYPNYALYGYPIIAKYGWECSYIDSESKSSRFQYLFRLIHLLFVKLSGGIGFSIERCITNLDKLKNSDMIFAASDSVALPILLLKKLKLINSPVVYFSVGLSHYMQNGGKRFIVHALKKIIGKADAVIFGTETERQDFQKVFGVPKSKLYYLSHPAGADIGFFDKFSGQADSKNYVLAAGRDTQRDYKTFFKAIAGLDMHFKVVTSKKNIRGLQVPPNVELFVDIDFIELLGLYKNANFVVIPLHDNNYSAGFTVLFQAMSLGKAVIISNVNAIKHSFHFRNMENCILVPPGDTVKLESSIKLLYENDKTRNNLGDNAQKLIRSNYSMELFVRRLNDLFKDILSGRAKQDAI